MCTCIWFTNLERTWDNIEYLMLNYVSCMIDRRPFPPRSLSAWSTSSPAISTPSTPWSATMTPCRCHFLCCVEKAWSSWGGRQRALWLCPTSVCSSGTCGFLLVIYNLVFLGDSRTSDLADDNLAGPSETFCMSYLMSANNLEPKYTDLQLVKLAKIAKRIDGRINLWKYGVAS